MFHGLSIAVLCWIKLRHVLRIFLRNSLFIKQCTQRERERERDRERERERERERKKERERDAAKLLIVINVCVCGSAPSRSSWYMYHDLIWHFQGILSLVLCLIKHCFLCHLFWEDWYNSLGIFYSC